MANSEKKRNSINRSSEFNHVIDTLVDRGGDKVFTAMYQLICFAAYVGLNNNKRLEIKTNSKEEPIDLQLFVTNLLDRHIWTINLFAHGDVAKLVDHNSCIETFEEFANGGMHIISQRLSEHSTDIRGIETLMTMLKLVNATQKKKSKKQERKITF
tara:strand:- start:363 stop:830 length:468 start_codon:yes stop_codon:yes gene_type:complete